MTAKSPEAKKLAESMSALRTQRDAHQRRNVKLETENRLLRRHQEDIRTWLASGIERWHAAADDEKRAISDELIQEATQRLNEAQRVARK